MGRAANRTPVTAHTPGTTHTSRRGSLPQPLTALVGREVLAADLATLVASNRLVTLTGAGGVGKTRLAVHLAASSARHGGQPAWFADLSFVPDAAQVPGAVAEAIGVQLGSGAAVDQLTDALARRPGLLVLDNCEHVVDAAAELAEAILTDTGTTILATSRERLGIDGEVERVVPPLDTTGPDPAARRLFLERASRHDPELAGQDDERDAVIDELCARLDGLPLAIELAAARVRVMAPRDLLDRIDDRFRLLTTPRRPSRDGRDRALKTTIDWSYDHLPEPERECLQRLGVFVGTFDAAAAAAVCGLDTFDVLDVLDALVGKSMVEVAGSGTTRRFRLLESMRAYARDRLAEDGRLEESRETHALWYRDSVALPDPWFMPPADTSASQARDWPNIRAAAEWFAAHDRWTDAAIIAGGCAGIVCDQGFGWDVQPLVDRCLAHGTMLERGVLDLVRVTSMLIGLTTGDWLRHEQVLEELSDAADPAVRATAVAQRALVRLYGSPPIAEQYVNEALSIASGPGVSPAAGVVPHLMDGARRMVADDVEGAIRVLERARDTCLALGSRNVFYAWASDAIAVGHLVAGRPREAMRELQRDPVPSLFDRSRLLECVVLAGLDRADEAADRLAAYLAEPPLRRLAGHANDTAVALASLAIALGHPDGAIRLLTESSPRHINMYPLALDLARRVGAEDAVRAGWLERFAAGPERGSIGEADDAVQAELDRLGMRAGEPAKDAREPHAFLTPREGEILGLVGQGLSNRQIARGLSLSEKTVKNHLSSVFVKLGVTDRTQAALYAVRHGLAGGSDPADLTPFPDPS